MSTNRQPGASRRAALRAASVGAAVTMTVTGAGIASAATTTVPGAGPRAIEDCVPTYTPPAITAFGFTPISVDVRSGSKNVTVTAKATDADHGVASVTAIYASPKKGSKQSFAAATLKRSAGTSANGTFKGTATVSRWVIPGTWQVTAVIATDKAGASTYLGYAELGARKWRRTLAVKATPDLTAPQLKAFSLSPTSVDTRSKTVKVTVTAKATDTQAGVSSLVATLTKPTGRKDAVSGTLKRVSGTSKNGSYKGTITVPRWVGNATWNASAYVNDAAFNARTYSTSALKAKKWKRTVAVKSSTDSTAPTITTETFTPGDLDVSNGRGSVTATASLKDAGSGVRSASITWTSPSGYQSFTASLKRISGTANAGTWKGTGTLFCFAETGTWTASAKVTDVAGNTRSYSTAQLAAAGWKTELGVAGIA